MVSMKSPCPAFLISFMSWSNSSSSTFNALRNGIADEVSSVASMLKGTLDQIEKEAVEDGSIVPNGTINQGQFVQMSIVSRENFSK
ncbi:hypothetical protein V6N13_029051 [Hibiscus sabdariffa]|uniref:Uncharacterized protein n=2 Tax=Hibiscus sabdariffa TaxID=183260 RepID=A0ABR2ASH1_9ROSI